VVQKLVKADEAESELAKLAQQKANNGELKDSLRRSIKVTKGEVISVTISETEEMERNKRADATGAIDRCTHSPVSNGLVGRELTASPLANNVIPRRHRSVSFMLVKNQFADGNHQTVGCSNDFHNAFAAADVQATVIVNLSLASAVASVNKHGLIRHLRTGCKPLLSDRIKK